MISTGAVDVKLLVTGVFVVDVGVGVVEGVGVTGVDGGDCLILISLIFGEVARFFDSKCWLLAS